MFRNLKIKTNVMFAMILMTIIVLIVGLAGILCMSQMNKSQEEIAKVALPRTPAPKSMGETQTSPQRAERTFGIIRGVLIATIVLSLILAMAIGIRVTRDVSNSIEGLKEEVGTIVKSSIEGRPATRGDPEKVSHEFQNIVKGFNDALDACIRTTDQQAATAQKVIAGDLTVQVHVRSEQDILAIGMNNVIASLNNLRNEIKRLAKASKDGMLSERGRPEEFRGGYAEMVQDVNEMLDAILLPLGESNRILNSIRSGNLREKFESPCKGEHERLKEAVNGLHAWLSELVAYVANVAHGDLDAAIPKGSEEDQLHAALVLMRNNMHALVDDTSMLAKAAAEGNFAARADVAKHHGDFRKIIAGVDEILDAVIEPLKVAAEYRERISVGEISEKMPDSKKSDSTNIFLEMVARNKPYF